MENGKRASCGRLRDLRQPIEIRPLLHSLLLPRQEKSVAVAVGAGDAGGFDGAGEAVLFPGAAVVDHRVARVHDRVADAGAHRAAGSTGDDEGVAIV